MKALVWTGRDRIQLQDRPAPEPKSDEEAVVRVMAAGICRTDVHMIQGRISFGKAPPLVLGHEIAGVEEKTGRRVIVDPILECGTCAFCNSGRKQLCRVRGELGMSGGDGGYAERVVVPKDNLYKLPQTLSFEEGTLIEPLNCALSAFEKAAPGAGEPVLIVGSGTSGLLFVQLAKVFGCKPIMVVGGGTIRLELAKQLGATHVWDYRQSVQLEVSPVIVVEAAGTPQAIASAFEWVRPGERVVLYGLAGQEFPTIRSDVAVTKELTIVTGVGSPRMWNLAIHLATAGKIQLRPFVTHKFKLGQIHEALRAAEDEDRAVKVVLTP